MQLNKTTIQKTILGVKAEEFKVTLVSVAYFFFVISAYYVIKPIRGSLALELGADKIPVLNILSMITLIIGNAVYSIIVGKYKRDIFIPFITKFFVFCIIIFWIMFSFVFPLSGTTKVKDVKAHIQAEALNKPAPIQGQTINSKESSSTSKTASNININTGKTICIAIYYLWVNIFALLAVSMFWSLMNDVYSVDQSRRLYAIIGYGGLLGGLMGGSITSFAVRSIGTQNLFLIAILLLYPSIWCMKYIHSNHYNNNTIPPKPITPSVVPAHPPRPYDGFKEVIKAPILIFMAFELFTYTFSSTLYFQQLNVLVENSFGNNIAARTAFIAGMYTRINALSLFTQFFVTKLIMMLKNPIFGLVTLNLVQVVGSILMLTNPSLAVVSWAIIIRYALNYSTGRAIRELIYIPLSREQKYQGKGFIDTVIFRLGDGLSSLLLIGGLHFFSFGPWIDITILLVMLFQLYVIFRIANIYSLRVEGQIKD